MEQPAYILRLLLLYIYNYNNGINNISWNFFYKIHKLFNLILPIPVNNLEKIFKLTNVFSVLLNT